MNNFLKQTLRLFAETLRNVQTLHCNVSTAGLILLLLSFHPSAFADLNDGLVAYGSFDNCTAQENNL